MDELEMLVIVLNTLNYKKNLMTKTKIKAYLLFLFFIATVITACITPKLDNVTTEETETVEETEVVPEGFVAPTPQRGPGYNTPIPPQGTVHWFVHFYNERNASMLYFLFSDRVKTNHTVEEIEKHFAYGVKIVKWEEVGEERISPPTYF